MPAWIIALLIPIAKALGRAALIALEKKYPGLTPIIDKILELLKAGVPADQIAAHIDRFGIGQPANLVGE